MIENLSAALPSELNNAVEQAIQHWDAKNNTDRLWKKDASLWTNSGEEKWLGWLDIVDQQLTSVSRFKAFAAEVHEDGFAHVLLLGMGGSSLCPEVFSLTFGKQPNAPELLVLDSTDPAQIKSLREKIRPPPHAVLRLFEIRHDSRAEHLHAVFLRRDEESCRR